MWWKKKISRAARTECAYATEVKRSKVSKGCRGDCVKASGRVARCALENQIASWGHSHAGIRVCRRGRSRHFLRWHVGRWIAGRRHSDGGGHDYGRRSRICKGSRNRLSSELQDDTAAGNVFAHRV